MALKSGTPTDTLHFFSSRLRSKWKLNLVLPENPGSWEPWWTLFMGSVAGEDSVWLGSSKAEIERVESPVWRVESKTNQKKPSCQSTMVRDWDLNNRIIVSQVWEARQTNKVGRFWFSWCLQRAIFFAGVSFMVFLCMHSSCHPGSNLLLRDEIHIE